MPRALPKYVERFRDKTGKVRLYFRRDKKSGRVPLPGAPNSVEFAEAYAAALAGMPQQSALVRPAPNTVAALITSYKRSGDFHDVRASTKQGYMSCLRILENAHGHRSLTGMTPARVEKHILQPYADRPGQRHALLKMLRIVLRHGRSVGFIKGDPTEGIKRAKLKKIRSWTEEEIAQFESRWPVGTKQRLAFALMLDLGQRRSDVRRLRWTDIKNGCFVITQQKTGEEAFAPILPDLAIVLQSAPRDHVTILTTRAGAPFTVDGFSQYMREAITAAGLPLACRPHGLRKTKGRRMASEGASTHAIMATLGHTDLASAQLYTAEFDREKSAKDAAKQSAMRQTQNRNSQTKLKNLGKIAKKEGKST
jgi:integrase